MTQAKERFKHNLHTPILIPTMHYVNAQISRAGEIYPARLRRECSSLNNQPYQNNLNDNPYCTCTFGQLSTHFSCSATSTVR